MVFYKREKRQIFIKKQKVKIDQYYHVLYNKKNGKTISFRIHKIFPYSVVLLTLVLVFALIGFIKYNFYLNDSVAKLEKVNDLNRDLKSEVEALTSKIKNIQITMNQVQSLSNKIKKASVRSDDRVRIEEPKREETAQQGTDMLGFGPLTKEDYEISKKLTCIKQEHLQLKTLFDEADESESESSKKLDEFKKLIVDLRKYNQKLHLIPDIAPTRGRISSTYGWRMSPFSGRERMHLGLDIAAPLGSPIYATADGVVVKAASRDDYGRMVEVRHSNKLLTRYAHTSIVYVKEGDKIKKGDVIAAVGSTGRSTGPHVHYEIEVDGKRTDPDKYIVLW